MRTKRKTPRPCPHSAAPLLHPFRHPLPDLSTCPCAVIPSRSAPRSKYPWGADWSWQSVPRARRRGTPKPPLCKGRWRKAPEGLSKGTFRAPARVTFGRSPKSDQKVCLKPKVSRLPARYALWFSAACTARSRKLFFVVRSKGLALRLRRCRWFLPR